MIVPTFRIESSGEDPVVLSISGELDDAVVPALREELERQRSLGASVVVDASRLDFCDSSGLRALLEGDRSFRRAGRSFSIVPSDLLRRLITIVGLTRELDLRQSLDLAQGGGSGTTAPDVSHPGRH